MCFPLPSPTTFKVIGTNRLFNGSALLLSDPASDSESAEGKLDHVMNCQDTPAQTERALTNKSSTVPLYSNKMLSDQHRSQIVAPSNSVMNNSMDIDRILANRFAEEHQSSLTILEIKLLLQLSEMSLHT